MTVKKSINRSNTDNLPTTTKLVSYNNRLNTNATPYKPLQNMQSLLDKYLPNRKDGSSQASSNNIQHPPEKDNYIQVLITANQFLKKTAVYLVEQDECIGKLIEHLQFPCNTIHATCDGKPINIRMTYHENGV